MTTNNPDPLEAMWEALKQECNPDAKDVLSRFIAQHYAPVIAENERLRAENYKTFTDGMEAAAQICGSLAETTYDDTDAFEAATGCEAEIMKVVKQQRKEQALAALDRRLEHLGNPDNRPIGEPVETGGHDIDRDGPPAFFD